MAVGLDTKRRAALGLLLIASVAPTARAQTLTITNITVVDVTNGHLSPHMNVAVDGKRITAVSSKTLTSSSGATFDGTGMYLIPGLWDMHIHAFFTNDSTRFHTTSELMLPLFVANGVTGVRDMGSNLEAILAARDSVAAHQLIGPRMVVSGPMLDGPTSRYQVIIKITTAEDARAAVRKLKERGVDFIKTQSLVPRDAYFAVADESRRQGIRFEGHVPYAIRGAEAIDVRAALVRTSPGRVRSEHHAGRLAHHGRSEATFDLSGACTTMPRKRRSSPPSASITSGNARPSRRT